MLLTIIINCIIYAVGTISSIIVALTSFRALIEDIIIIRRGNKFEGECIDGRFYGREYYLIVQWNQDDIQHEDRFLAVCRIKKYPYKVSVYSYNYKTNLGITSLLYNLLYLIIFLAILIAFCVFLIYR